MLDLRALTGVITHNPGDMTVSVRAGTPLRELNAELADHGQHVAFDAARVADGATVGGLLATGDAGPAALVHGSLRDLVIGTTLVLADGTVARSGGHVIKNVAGYDLAKLVHGSYGTLAVVAEVVLRLHPLPRAVATLVLPCTLDEAAGHAARILGGPYEPAALEWVSDPGALLVRMEGTEAALPERVARLQELLGPAAVRGRGAEPRRPPTRPPPSAVPADGPRRTATAHSDGTLAPDLGRRVRRVRRGGRRRGPGTLERATRRRGSPSPVTSGPVAGTGPTRVPLVANRGRSGTRAGTAAGAAAGTTAGAGRADDPWAGHTRLTRGTLDDAVLRIGVRPSRLPGVLAGLPARSITAGLGTGVATVALPADPAAVAAAHAAVHAAGGTSVLRSRPAGFDGPAWGPPPSALAVLRAVKKELDPAGRLGPGRFAPWLTEGAS